MSAPTTPPAWMDAKALEVARRFTAANDPQRLAMLQCAVIEAMQFAESIHGIRQPATGGLRLSLLRRQRTRVQDVREQAMTPIESLIESARLLGSTQAKKGFGCYTEEDGRFERAMHESIAKHRATVLAAHPPVSMQQVAWRWAPKFIADGRPGLRSDWQQMPPTPGSLRNPSQIEYAYADPQGAKA